MISYSKNQLKKVKKLMKGREPVNPLGNCFDSSLSQMFAWEEDPPELVLCHAIGIANFPGQEGEEMAHAWVEFTTPKGEKAAVDTTYNLIIDAAHYRKQLNIKYLVCYTKEQLLKEHKDEYHPFDKKIRDFLREQNLLVMEE